MVKLTMWDGSAICFAHDDVARVAERNGGAEILTKLGEESFFVRESVEAVVALIAAEREAERRARGTRFARLTEQGGRAFALNPAVVVSVSPERLDSPFHGTEIWTVMDVGDDAEPFRAQTPYEETLRLLEEAAGGEGR